MRGGGALAALRRMRRRGRRAPPREAPAAELAVELPRRLTLETTHRCNLRCPFCLHTLHQGPSASMEGALFDALAAETFGAGREVALSVTGEPFLSPRFDTECAAIARSGARLVTYTNGTRLAAALRSDSFRAAVGHLSVSLDAASEPLFEILRPPARWSEVIAGIRGYERWRRTRPERPGLELVLVLQRANLHELVDWIDLARELGADSAATSHLVVHTEAMRDQSLAWSESSRAASDAWIERARLRAAEIGLEASFPLPFGAAAEWVSEPADPGPVRCRLPWTETWIDASGRVYPCCFPDRVPSLGNAADSGFAAVWNGPGYRAWRRAMLGTDEPEPCRRCHLARPATSARYEVLRGEQ